MRPGRPDAAGSRWLPLAEVAPVPGLPRVVPIDGSLDPDADAARAEVAATAMAVAPPVPGALVPAVSRRRSAASWKGSTVAILAVAMVLAAAAGALSLREHRSARRRADASVAVPGTSLLVDKPEGWTEGPLESAPAILSDLVDTGAKSDGLYFSGPGNRALFVVDAPNSADLDTVPPVADHIGAATVTEQSATTHALGPARRVSARGMDGGTSFEFDATYVLTGGRIVVVGTVAEDALQDKDVAAATAMLESLHQR